MQVINYELTQKGFSMVAPNVWWISCNGMPKCIDCLSWWTSGARGRVDRANWLTIKKVVVRIPLLVMFYFLSHYCLCLPNSKRYLVEWEVIFEWLKLYAIWDDVMSVCVFAEEGELLAKYD